MWQVSWKDTQVHRQFFGYTMKVPATRKSCMMWTLEIIFQDGRRNVSEYIFIIPVRRRRNLPDVWGPNGDISGPVYLKLPKICEGMISFIRCRTYSDKFYTAQPPHCDPSLNGPPPGIVRLMKLCVHLPVRGAV